MDISFDILNSQGDLIRVALSSYDKELIQTLSNNSETISLKFYDVSLIRVSGSDYVDYKILATISRILANFLNDNADAILCFYCDANSDVRRKHRSMLPQEFRSNLFSRMFERYCHSHAISNFVNHRVEIIDSADPGIRQYAHFICRENQKEAVIELGYLLMQK